jgi:hypothetical protein
MIHLGTRIQRDYYVWKQLRWHNNLLASNAVGIFEKRIHILDSEQPGEVR